jgi:hypothetical protein
VGAGGEAPGELLGELVELVVGQIGRVHACGFGTRVLLYSRAYLFQLR